MGWDARLGEFYFTFAVVEKFLQLVFSRKFPTIAEL